MWIFYAATHRWLRLHRLHKYLFIFSNLTYEQILAISEENIDNIQTFVGLFKMTVGAKNKILREIEELRKRKLILMDILKVCCIPNFLDGFILFSGFKLSVKFKMIFILLNIVISNILDGVHFLNRNRSNDSRNQENFTNSNANYKGGKFASFSGASTK